MSVSSVASSCPVLPSSSNPSPSSQPLGTIGKFASARTAPRKSQTPDQRAENRATRFALQSVARRLLPDEAVSRCLRVPIPTRQHVDVYHQPQHRSASFGGLQVCGSPWACPVCAQRIAERRRAELARAIEVHRAAGGVVLIAALTVSHTRHDVLRTLLATFLAAVKEMQSGRPWTRLREAYGLLGMVRALETTWGPVHGWHPHIHLLLFLDAPVAWEGVSDEDRAGWVATFEDDLFGQWEYAAACHGLAMARKHGLVVQQTDGAVMDYVAKWGCEPAARPWGPEDEMAKAHVKQARSSDDAADAGQRYKPFDLLRQVLATGEVSGPGALFCEYVWAFKGRSQLRWTPELRKRLLSEEREETDEELARRHDADAVLLGSLSLDDWRAVLRADARAAVLTAAATGAWAAVLAVLDGAYAAAAHLGPMAAAP